MLITIISNYTSEYENHLAVSLDDLDHSIKCYRELFGFIMVARQLEFVADASLLG
jgi:hypothetical protein